MHRGCNMPHRWYKSPYISWTSCTNDVTSHTGSVIAHKDAETVHAEATTVQTAPAIVHVKASTDHTAPGAINPPFESTDTVPFMSHVIVTLQFPAWVCNFKVHSYLLMLLRNFSFTATSHANCISNRIDNNVLFAPILLKAFWLRAWISFPKNCECLLD